MIVILYDISINTDSFGYILNKLDKISNLIYPTLNLVILLTFYNYSLYKSFLDFNTF